MPRTNIWKEENNDVITHIIEIRQNWKEYFNNLLNINGTYFPADKTYQKVEEQVQIPTLKEVKKAIDN